uniref:Uncharacterized protein n=1 Tax=Nelumbo nucifera TaxID=4432 RepID=A0A822Z5Q4_NELNU|nr:TPA_asm: hypothetical protein HUJ06_008966 [Nelumbo nucifera]
MSSPDEVPKQGMCDNRTDEKRREGGRKPTRLGPQKKSFRGLPTNGREKQNQIERFQNLERKMFEFLQNQRDKGLYARPVRKGRREMG